MELKKTLNKRNIIENVANKTNHIVLRTKFINSPEVILQKHRVFSISIFFFSFQ